MGLRERKRLETYLRIEDKATQLFLDKSYEEVTLEEICEEAMVSRRTFFNYFQSKEHVAVGTMPVTYTAEDYTCIEQFRVPEGSTFAREFTALITTGRIAHARQIFENSINPKLEVELALRRIELIRRSPALGMSKLSSFEQSRMDLIAAVAKNFETYPEHQLLSHRSPQEEARLLVTSTTISLWAASALPLETEKYTVSEYTAQQTMDDFASLFQAMVHPPIFPDATGAGAGNTPRSTTAQTASS